ncbi:UDP-N-acetylglucosamine 2-epimerase (non-hydrolyzing) [Nocardioides daedukensis]|uniref:UDP-N-acetylglucosamine 2-epimerase (Non-hydrolyzing) n=1 Tax=Nocardioides daedukensis TaxID=634462 RepID=A0A7Y9UTD1_9ACTN|nr:UDP-N-acetylglucosamine 2-epimerase (non-hydrolyzing) [Nocardioides daedukensis]NYG57884.1 UDP-N-acetylglucosamine 2-epimerase (non-hydrolyzing) [Nocardioides daedukensis]
MSNAVWHVTGARPNFPKAAPVVAALNERGISQGLVHTGQHYDDNMSTVFFEQLKLPRPDINLGVGSGSHAQQTATIMTGLEELFLKEQPKLVVVYGDVNSTVAAALVASKLHIPVAHVEAGLRSFDMTMPEEVNRIVTDRLSNLLLATSPDAIAHLAHEGVAADRIHLVGNPMIDTLLSFVKDSGEAPHVEGFEIPDGPFAVATLHRPANVDDPGDLNVLKDALHATADQLPVVMPVHPRGKARMTEIGLFDHDNMHAVEPLGYLEFLGLVRRSALVVTDSGGIQEETTVLGVPCLTLRPNTERPVTITHGTNQLVTAPALAGIVKETLAAGRPTTWKVPPLWDGQAGPRIAEVIDNFLAAQG